MSAQDQDTQRLGQQIGSYRLINFLGKGGFADVYLGEHIYLHTQNAIKILRMQLSEDSLQDFLTEAQTIARLEHPHIVHVFDYGVQGDTPFLVMSYAPNGTLRTRYPRHTRLPLEHVVPLVHQLASALDYAHQLKLIHRDVKPENMLIGPQNQVLLSDFGLALSATNSSSQVAVNTAGTVPYMAPEQLQGRVRYASDQYALGIVAYEWLCGERPFNGTFTEIASQHVLVPPPSLSQRIPSLPLEVEDVVFKALAKEPARRFPHVQDFAQALQQASQLPGSSTSQLFFLPTSSSPLTPSAPLSTRLETRPNYHTIPMPGTQDTPVSNLPTRMEQTPPISRTNLIANTPTAQMNAASHSLHTNRPTSRFSRRWQLSLLLVLILLLIGGAMGIMAYTSQFSRSHTSSAQQISHPLQNNNSSTPQAVPSHTPISSITSTATTTSSRSSTNHLVPTASAAPIAATTSASTPTTIPTPTSTSNNVSSNPTPIPTATPTPTPDCISSSPTSLTFTSFLGQTANPRDITLTNCGGTTQIWTSSLQISSLQTQNGSNWLAISPTSNKLAPNASGTIQVSVFSSGLTAGSYTGTITITSGTATTTITVFYTIFSS